MQNLEQTVETSFLSKVRTGLNQFKQSTFNKIAVYSLAGVLGAGSGYNCSEDNSPKKNDALETEVNFDIPRETRKICWNKKFGGSNDDEAYSIQQTSDGGYIMAGETGSKSVGARLRGLARGMGDSFWGGRE